MAVNVDVDVDVDVGVAVAIVIAEDSGVVVAEVAGVIVISLLADGTEIRRGVFSPRRVSSLEDELEVDTIVVREWRMLIRVYGLFLK